MNTTLSRVLATAWIALASAIGSRAAAPQVSVVATTTLVADLVRSVGGDRIAVEALMGAGVDPHLYKASARDVTRLSRADIVFYSGLFLEGRMEDVFRNLARSGRKVHSVTEAIPKDRLLGSSETGDHPDPHVWGDPRLWAIAARTVATHLSAADPAGATAYQDRLQRTIRQFEELAAWGKKRAALVPEQKRVLITSHDAFAYFGRAFEFQVVGVQGISTASEAGLADIAKVADLVRSRELKAIFVETSVAPAAIERIGRDSGARIGGELFSDALGAPGENRKAGEEAVDVGTYVGMLKYNLETVVQALR